MYAGLHLDTRFALLDGLLLAASFALSSIPDADPSGPLVTAFFNVMHVPLFGAVAFCSYKALAKGRELPRAEGPGLAERKAARQQDDRRGGPPQGLVKPQD